MMRVVVMFTWVVIVSTLCAYSLSFVTMLIPSMSVLTLPFYLFTVPPFLYTGLAIIDARFSTEP